MLAIRLTRAGAKKRPFYRVVVAESRNARDSRFVEILGHYNPRSQPAEVRVDRERFEHWIRVGAQPSHTVRTLVARHLSVQPSLPSRADSPAAPPDEGSHKGADHGSDSGSFATVPHTADGAAPPRSEATE